jgi:thiosulfate/3-mercaptopyruvate sulfurtransferase
MTYTTLISTAELSQHLTDPNWVTVDCRFMLAAPERGEQNYLQAHIAGAAYAHLDRDLSSAVIPGVTGRHPWPSVEQVTHFFSQIGIAQGVQVVAYDDAGGALAAARLWGMLRWLGHTAVAILDGGWQKWMGEDRPVKSGLESRPPRTFFPHPRPGMFVTAGQIEKMRQDARCRVFDARTAERYRGENESIDPIAGHIPGAISAPYLENLTQEGVFRPPQELRAHYQALLGNIPVENTAFYCGSGVTSIHDILAMLVAGLGEPKLYAGSWSEWIAPRTRPVATGVEP